MKNRGIPKLSPSKEITYISITCALLIGGQYVFAALSGVEIVTLILASFSFVFGARRGATCAVAFSLLRCVVFGFSYTAVVLYLLYYPLLALVFGILGTLNVENTVCAVAVNACLLFICIFCLVVNFGNLLVTSRIVKYVLTVLLWIVFSIAVLYLTVYDCVLFAKKKLKKNVSALLKIITAVSCASFLTIIFSLIDDIITPLFLGFSSDGALGYFYASFTAMLPQTLCAIVTFSTLFIPLTSVMNERLSNK